MKQALLVLSAFLCSTLSVLAQAQVEIGTPGNSDTQPRAPLKEGQAFGISFENDSRRIGGPGLDQAYSNGVKISYTYARDKIPNWVPKFFLESEVVKKEMKDSASNFGISLNHQIYTPNNTAVVGLITNDRPYAAWLGLVLALNVKADKYSHVFDASIGAIGPVAIGEQVQNGFHRAIGTTTAAGWGNQLKNEPALQFGYQRRFRFLEFRIKKEPYFDIIPMLGAGVGNIFVGAHAGAIARLGINLPDNFGPTRMSSSESDSFVSPNTPAKEPNGSYFVFAGFRGNAVARNIFLDGNTFLESHRVKKYPFTAETEIGVGIHFFPISLIWCYVVRSPDFEENSGFNSFASVGITYITH